MSITGFNISAVERDTGISKDLLRMWERRYGFPSPSRDDFGERVYVLPQIERLRVIKRLIDSGFRPGKLLSKTDTELQALLSTHGATNQSEDDLDCEPYLALLRNSDLHELRACLQKQIAQQGLRRFVQDTAAPITVAIGEAWMQGSIRIHEEHAYSEMLHGLLRHALLALPHGTGPRLILTTLPGEEHSLGLLMAEVLFTLEGAHCISLGTRMPVVDIVLAAKAHAADAVALSFSTAFSPRQAAIQLSELRQQLPEEIALWIGGAGSERIPTTPGVFAKNSQDGPQELILGWHKTSREAIVER